MTPQTRAKYVEAIKQLDVIGNSFPVQDHDPIQTLVLDARDRLQTALGEQLAGDAIAEATR